MFEHRKKPLERISEVCDVGLPFSGWGMRAPL
jgi:hypothetical protein